MTTITVLLERLKCGYERFVFKGISISNDIPHALSGLKQMGPNKQLFEKQLRNNCFSSFLTYYIVLTFILKLYPVSARLPADDIGLFEKVHTLLLCFISVLQMFLVTL